MKNVRIGEVVLWGTFPPGGQGFVVDEGGFDGWEDGVDVRRKTVDRVAAHGSFDAPGFLDSRSVSFSGNCVASSPEKLAWFRSQLTGLLAGGGSGRLVVDHAGQSLWTDVRLASKTKFATRGTHATTAKFQVQLWSANPRLFGESRTFSGPSGVLLPVHHYGNFPASPVLTVSGAMPSGYTVAWGGRRYTVTRPVAADAPHIIDLATGFLEVGGVVQSGAVTTADVWSVPAGTVAQHFLNPVSGGGTLTVNITDTYI